MVNICDCCGKETELKTYMLPDISRPKIPISIVGEAMILQGQVEVNPKEVNLCDDCALKMFYKMHWKG